MPSGCGRTSGGTSRVPSAVQATTATSGSGVAGEEAPVAGGTDAASPQPATASATPAIASNVLMPNERTPERPGSLPIDDEQRLQRRVAAVRHPTAGRGLVAERGE